MSFLGRGSEMWIYLLIAYKGNTIDYWPAFVDQHLCERMATKVINPNREYDKTVCEKIWVMK